MHFTGPGIRSWHSWSGAERSTPQQGDDGIYFDLKGQEVGRKLTWTILSYMDQVLLFRVDPLTLIEVDPQVQGRWDTQWSLPSISLCASLNLLWGFPPTHQSRFGDCKGKEKASFVGQAKIPLLANLFHCIWSNRPKLVISISSMGVL